MYLFLIRIALIAVFKLNWLFWPYVTSYDFPLFKILPYIALNYSRQMLQSRLKKDFCVRRLGENIYTQTYTYDSGGSKVFLSSPRLTLSDLSLWFYNLSRNVSPKKQNKKKRVCNCIRNQVVCNYLVQLIFKKHCIFTRAEGI